MAEQSPIFIKTEAFIVWLFQHTSKFPKHERFRLAKEIDDAALTFYKYILRAAQFSDSRNYLQEADLQLDMLRTYLRLAVELKYTTPKQYQHAALHTTEIGKLLGGWLKKA